MMHNYRRSTAQAMTAAVLLALPLYCASLCFAPLAMAAEADGNRYGAWTPPDAQAAASQNKDVNALVKELNALVREAESSRAANPLFLRDLKALAARYDRSMDNRVLFDDFSDNDYQRNPEWSVTSGEYWVEQGYGLRSKVVDAAPAGGGSAPISKEKLALSILGAVLQGANKNSDKNSGNSGSAPVPAVSPSAKASAIETRARINNAFDATLEMSSWQAQGTFALGIHQGLGGLGYRLEYTAGQNAMLQLVRVTSSGRAVIDSKAIAALEDQKIHSFNWQRSVDGSMNISLDDKAVLSARDGSFRDAFDGVELASQGADVIVKSISVAGSR
ncbi:MAG: hypothetical protein NUV50_03555 [Rhodospirillales bacterium]|nr:hypothetical protein [Rhodospirillales bacterium]